MQVWSESDKGGWKNNSEPSKPVGPPATPPGYGTGKLNLYARYVLFFNLY